MEAKSKENDCCLIGFIILLQILQLSQAHIGCIVTQDGGRTLYTVQRMEEAKDCFYFWINMTGHVLANHEGQIDNLVETNTNYSLRTRECFPVVRYEQNCLSEESLREAHCNTSCSENVNVREEGNTRHHWIIAIDIIVAVCLFLFWIFRNRLCRHETVEQEQDVVKTQNDRPKMDDVEAQLA